MGHKPKTFAQIMLESDLVGALQDARKGSGKAKLEAKRLEEMAAGITRSTSTLNEILNAHITRVEDTRAKAARRAAALELAEAERAMRALPRSLRKRAGGR